MRPWAWTLDELWEHGHGRMGVAATAITDGGRRRRPGRAGALQKRGAPSTTHRHAPARRTHGAIDQRTARADAHAIHTAGSFTLSGRVRETDTSLLQLPRHSTAVMHDI